jgi:hypothetical protein
MAELVAELIRELTPIERADIDDDPSRVWFLFVKPNMRWTGRVDVDPRLRRLQVGQQSYSRQATDFAARYTWALDAKIGLRTSKSVSDFLDCGSSRCADMSAASGGSDQ